MYRQKLQGTYRNIDGIHTEEIKTNYEENPLTAYKKHTQRYNKTLNQYETEKTPISAKWITKPNKWQQPKNWKTIIKNGTQ